VVEEKQPLLSETSFLSMCTALEIYQRPSSVGERSVSHTSFQCDLRCRRSVQLLQNRKDASIDTETCMLFPFEASFVCVFVGETGVLQDKGLVRYITQ